MASPMPLPGRREYPNRWPMPARAEVLPMRVPSHGKPIPRNALLTRNADIDLRRDELVWAPTNN